MNSIREKRRFVRVNDSGKVWIRWMTPEGTPRGTRATVVDRSNGGLGLALDAPVEPFSYVHLESRDLNYTGIAAVRHCCRKGSGWLAGVQTAARQLSYD